MWNPDNSRTRMSLFIYIMQEYDFDHIEREARLIHNWPLSSSAPLVANSCRSVYIAQKMVSEGVADAPSDAILWAIYTELHWVATRGTELESDQLRLIDHFPVQRLSWRTHADQWISLIKWHLKWSIDDMQTSLRGGVSAGQSCFVVTYLS